MERCGHEREKERERESPLGLYLNVSGEDLNRIFISFLGVSPEVAARPNVSIGLAAFLGLELKHN